MMPVLSHIEKYQDLNFWVTTEGICGVGFQITPCDIETENAEDFGQRLIQVLRQIDSRVLGRVKIEVFESSDLPETFARAKAVNAIGFAKKRTFLYLDYVGGFHALKELKTLFGKESGIEQEQFKALIKTKSLFEQYGFKLAPLSFEDIQQIFDRGHSAWIKSSRSIEAGAKSIGVVRLLKQPLDEFSERDWIETIDALPKPFSVTLSFQKMDEARAKLLLERKLKQMKTGKDISAKAQESATEDLILKNFQAGTQFFEMEILFVFERHSQAELSTSLSKAASDISMFSEGYIETFGVAPSFCAILPGNQQHVPLIETDQSLAVLLPLWTRGEASPEPVSTRGSLTLLRDDNSLHHFDLFNQGFNVFNTLIVGTSGKGKSVLTGLLTSSLLNDPNVTVIKLDVGGSHSKECEIFGGEEFQLSLDRPSGINPFEVLKIEAASDNDKLGILSKFLGAMIQEQGELVLSKSLRSEVENVVREYIDSAPKAPCLDDFYRFAKGFPRRDLLRRWVKGGVYESAFACVANDVDPLLQFRASSAPLCSRARLRYYNFSQIFQAADPEFAQAGIAAVLAQFNMEMLKNNGTRLVLICDETPFFVRSCFEFFKFSTANVRKYGHAVCLISQLSTDFVVGGDMGIIENSPQRFLFSVDGNELDFGQRFNLSQDQINEIKSLKSIVGVFSEVLLQTGEVSRKLKVKVTPEEYWRLTTSRVDKEKIMKLLEAVPGLSLREAIACLAAV